MLVYSLPNVVVSCRNLSNRAEINWQPDFCKCHGEAVGDTMNSEISALQLLQNALGATRLRQSVYSNNIANVDTPGYKRQDVQFESLLQQAMTDPQTSVDGNGYIPIAQPPAFNTSTSLAVQPTVVQDDTTVVQNNGNNVDVDAEMAKLAENQIHYNALVQDMTARFNRLKSAINGG